MNVLPVAILNFESERVNVHRSSSKRGEIVLTRGLWLVSGATHDPGVLLTAEGLDVEQQRVVTLHLERRETGYRRDHAAVVVARTVVGVREESHWIRRTLSGYKTCKNG